MGEPRSFNATSFDLIVLIHKATLELYGLDIDAEKSLRLAALLRDVAEGRRTFIESDSEEFAKKFEAGFDSEQLGITFEQFMHEERIIERNAARQLAGLPPIGADMK